MPGPTCPPWEYKDHTHYNAVRIRCEDVLEELRLGKLAIDETLRDTRDLHRRLFVGLTPAGCDYYAGGYRGSRQPNLRNHTVALPADARVGEKPGRVHAEMETLSKRIIPNGVKQLDGIFAKPDTEISAGDKLTVLVAFACKVLATFLRIHPYVNGNGHIGRLIVWLLLVKYGYWPVQWPLDGHPPYDDLLKRYRDGDRAPLEQFVLQAVQGPAVAPATLPSP